jgi:hypothetical protein
MKMFVQFAAALVVTLSVGHAFADENCNDHAYQRTRDYETVNEAQIVAVDVLRAVFYVECKSTYAEMAEDLSTAQEAALDAYEAGTNYNPLSTYVHNRFVVLARSLSRLESRLRTISKTMEAQNSAMRLRASLNRIHGLIGQ